MNRRATGVAVFMFGLGAVASLPLVGRALRAAGAERCALDGVIVPEATRVGVVAADGRSLALCCIDCARHWLRVSREVPREVRVVDETTGRSLPAPEAWFVRSRIVAFDVTGCRIHAFASEADAKSHAEHFGGTLLVGEQKPLP